MKHPRALSVPLSPGNMQHGELVEVVFRTASPGRLGRGCARPSSTTIVRRIIYQPLPRLWRLWRRGVRSWRDIGAKTISCPPEEKKRALVLLARAPNSRAWYRRWWLVMLRSRELEAAEVAHGGATKAPRSDGDETAFGAVVESLVRLEEDGVFRSVVSYL